MSGCTDMYTATTHGEVLEDDPWMVMTAIQGAEIYGSERLLLLNHAKTPGFLASGEEFSPVPETRLDRSELLCNKVLLKYKRDRESF